jgi:hypothetical protein
VPPVASSLPVLHMESRCRTPPGTEASIGKSTG